MPQFTLLKDKNYTPVSTTLATDMNVVESSLTFIIITNHLLRISVKLNVEGNVTAMTL